MVRGGEPTDFTCNIPRPQKSGGYRLRLEGGEVGHDPERCESTHPRSSSLGGMEGLGVSLMSEGPLQMEEVRHSQGLFEQPAVSKEWGKARARRELVDSNEVDSPHTQGKGDKAYTVTIRKDFHRSHLRRAEGSKITI